MVSGSRAVAATLLVLCVAGSRAHQPTLTRRANNFDGNFAGDIYSNQEEPDAIESPNTNQFTIDKLVRSTAPLCDNGISTPKHSDNEKLDQKQTIIYPENPRMVSRQAGWNIKRTLHESDHRRASKERRIDDLKTVSQRTNANQLRKSMDSRRVTDKIVNSISCINRNVDNSNLSSRRLSMETGVDSRKANERRINSRRISLNPRVENLQILRRQDNNEHRKKLSDFQRFGASRINSRRETDITDEKMTRNRDNSRKLDYRRIDSIETDSARHVDRRAGIRKIETSRQESRETNTRHGVRITAKINDMNRETERRSAILNASAQRQQVKETASFVRTDFNSLSNRRVNTKRSSSFERREDTRTQKTYYYSNTRQSENRVDSRRLHFNQRMARESLNNESRNGMDRRPDSRRRELKNVDPIMQSSRRTNSKHGQLNFRRSEADSHRTDSTRVDSNMQLQRRTNNDVTRIAIKQKILRIDQNSMDVRRTDGQQIQSRKTTDSRNNIISVERTPLDVGRQSSRSNQRRFTRSESIPLSDISSRRVIVDTVRTVIPVQSRRSEARRSSDIIRQAGTGNPKIRESSVRRLDNYDIFRMQNRRKSYNEDTAATRRMGNRIDVINRMTLRFESRRSNDRVDFQRFNEERSDVSRRSDRRSNNRSSEARLGTRRSENRMERVSATRKDEISSTRVRQGPSEGDNNSRMSIERRGLIRTADLNRVRIVTQTPKFSISTLSFKESAELLVSHLVNDEGTAVKYFMNGQKEYEETTHQSQTSGSLVWTALAMAALYQSLPAHLLKRAILTNPCY